MSAKRPLARLSPIPVGAQEKHLAILATSDAGKTVTAKSMVEDWAEAKEQTVILDPTGVWHGLRTMADGKPGYPFLIFGGKHADVPIDQYSGAALARLILDHGLMAIIDTKMLKPLHRTRLFADFAETIGQLCEVPLHLVVDECHRFMPQTPVRDREGLGVRMMTAANELVSGGRTAGFQVTMISQRASKVNKDSLNLAQTMVAMQNISAHDTKAVADWLKIAAPKETMQRIMSSLPGLQRGQGWIYSPRLKVLDFTQFPMMRTLNTSERPSPGEKRPAPANIASIDIASIRAALAVEEEHEEVERAPERSPRGDRTRRASPHTDQAEIEARIAGVRADALREGREIGRREERDFIRMRIGAALDALPPIGAANDVAGARTVTVNKTLPPTQSKMMEALRKSEHGLTKTALAAEIGVKSKDGRFYGHIDALRAIGLVSELDDIVFAATRANGRAA